MTQTVDLSLLRQMTSAALRVYEAAGQAGLLTAEGQRALAAAEELLQQTTAAYLPETARISDHKPVSAARQEMTADYIAIQKALAGMQDALYQYIQARAAARAYPEALTALLSLARIDPGYRDLPVLRSKLEQDREQSEKQQKEEAKRRLAEEKIQKRLEKMDAARRRPDQALPLSRGAPLLLRIIPAGEFLMGDNKTETSLDEFWMGKYPLTNTEYIAYEDAAGVEKRADRSSVKANHPVVNVSWNDANAYCRWASTMSGKGVRLPSDDEWEKAARGSDGREYPWGSQSPDASRCNFNNQAGGTTPAGQYSPKGDSPYGCADMSGNVWEWVQSRCLRGGSFVSSAVNVRCAVRFSPYGPGGRDGDLGFRVCVSPI